MKYKLLKPGDREAERGAFYLLYPSGQSDVPFDPATYLAVKRDEAEEITDPNVRNVSGLTMAEFAKRRLFTNNILLHNGSLLKMLAIRMATDMKDM